MGEHSPPFQGGVAATKENIAKPPQRSGRGGCSRPKTTPSALLRNGAIYLLAQPPLLGKEGNAPLFQFIQTLKHGRLRRCATPHSRFIFELWRRFIKLRELGGHQFDLRAELLRALFAEFFHRTDGKETRDFRNRHAAII